MVGTHGHPTKLPPYQKSGQPAYLRCFWLTNGLLKYVSDKHGTLQYYLELTYTNLPRGSLVKMQQFCRATFFWRVASSIGLGKPLKSGKDVTQPNVCDTMKCTVAASLLSSSCISNISLTDLTVPFCRSFGSGGWNAAVLVCVSLI